MLLKECFHNQLNPFLPSPGTWCWVRPATRFRAGWWRLTQRRGAGGEATPPWRRGSRCLISSSTERCACPRRRCWGWGHAGSAWARGTTAGWTWSPPWSWLAAFCTICASPMVMLSKQSGRLKWLRPRALNLTTDRSLQPAWMRETLRRSEISSVTILNSKAMISLNKNLLNLFFNYLFLSYS